MGRENLSLEIREKISRGLTGKISPFKGVIKIPREEKLCANVVCRKVFQTERWKRAKFCSVACAMHVTGSKPTSPKAARAKAGIRTDISDKIYFYSRWEANIARLFNFQNIKWVHQPATFDIGDQKYTPDFYLPAQDLYIEVKNFLGQYSKKRDDNFRRMYPNLRLKLLLKDEYLELEKSFAKFIPKWEYKSSKF